MNGWAKFISQVGFPIAISLILLGMFSGYIESPISRMSEALSIHVRADVKQVQLLRQICFNTAQTEPDRRACWAD